MTRTLKKSARFFLRPSDPGGNEISLHSTDDESRLIFKNLLDRLTEIANKEDSISSQQIRSIFFSLESGDDADIRAFRENTIIIPGGLRKVNPRSRLQAEYIMQMSSKDLVFSIGPAGTGKTYIAVAYALMELLSRKKPKNHSDTSCCGKRVKISVFCPVI